MGKGLSLAGLFLFFSYPALVAQGGIDTGRGDLGANDRPQASVDLDKGALEEVEELSESLANVLLDFSAALLKRDLQAAGEYFASTVEVVLLPGFPSTLPASVRWISENSIDLRGTEPSTVTREEMLDVLRSLLEGFSEIEDVRFKVKEAKFARKKKGMVGEGEIKFFLVGRDPSGKRVWLRGTGRLSAARSREGDWLISDLRFGQVDLMRADTDLFSEVSVPAEVSVSLPAYGSPGNNDFVYHGAAAGDVDGDGFLDLFVTGIRRNYLYLNRGDGTFREFSQEALIFPMPRATAPLLLDYDNDGDLDIFLAAVGDQILFENRRVPEGKLYFVDSSLESGIALPAVGFGAAAGDINGDGWTDIYVSSYNRYGRIMPNSWHRATNGTANLLFINRKDGRFKESGAAWGVKDSRWSYAAQFVDLNGDGRTDLYVVNDFGENALYINQGDHFEDQAKSWGLLDPGNGMGVSVGDYDNDSQLDLFVTNMSSMAGNRILDRLFPDADPADNVLKKLASGNTLFRGDSSGGFTDVSQRLGPFFAGWAWGGLFVDFDNDGWQDLYSPNGFVSGKSMKDT